MPERGFVLPRETKAKLKERIAELEESIQDLLEERAQVANEHYQALRKLEKYRDYIESLEE